MNYLHLGITGSKRRDGMGIAGSGIVESGEVYGWDEFKWITGMDHTFCV